MDTSDRRRALGAFLRAHREQLSPPVGDFRRRRTPGLRREELAEACGVSLTWVTWLEQGRDVSASPHALTRLAEALRLGAAERAYLFELADRRDPAAPQNHEGDLPAAVLSLPACMSVPTYVLDRTWRARAWNDPAAELFTGWLDDDHDRSLLHFLFLSPAAPRLINDWTERARRVTAEFRADFSRRLQDPAVQEVVEDLTARSPLFQQFWNEQAVLGREGGERRFRNPERRYVQSTLIVAAHPDIKLVVLMPL